MSTSLLLANRRVILTPKNPLDVSTVISIYPRRIHEVKPTLIPAEFIIEEGSPDKPAFLEVQSNSWFREVNEDEPLLEIPVSSVLIAESIVRDWRHGIHLNGPEQNPGLMFFPGQVKWERIVKPVTEEDKARKALFDRMVEQQKNWYAAIVKDADVLWARSNGNPIVISNDARYAAERLGLKEKSWMQDFKTLEMTNCPACGTLRNPNFPICGSCKTIVDPAKYKALGLSMAQ